MKALLATDAIKYTYRNINVRFQFFHQGSLNSPRYHESGSRTIAPFKTKMFENSI